MKFAIDLIMSTHSIIHLHIYPCFHSLMVIYRFMYNIISKEYHCKYHINVKRLLYFTLNNLKSLQFLVSISIEFQIFTPVCSTHVCFVVDLVYLTYTFMLSC